MKNGLMFLAVVLLFMNCTQQIELENFENTSDYINQVNYENPGVKKLLEDYYGIEIKQLKKAGNYIFTSYDEFVYEEDLPAIRKELSERNDSNEKQFRYHIYPAGLNGSTVKIKHTNLLQIEIDALLDAMDILNAISDLGLHFICYQKSNYDIKVTRGFFNSSLSCTAMAHRPTTTSFGDRIEVGQDAAAQGSDYLIATMLHEIMHTIGFAHDGDQSEVRIGNTPISDPNSIMYPCYCQQCNNMGLFGLSNQDIVALCLLYPDW